MANISTIPAGMPFARTLAKALLARTQSRPEALSHIKVLLPTRRACRVLREAFLQESGGRALILPRMTPLGDIDEDELSLSMGQEAALNIKPPIAALRRQMLLARTIMKLETFPQNAGQALSLAQALGHLIDQVHTENLSLSNLTTLVPENFAEHWQITLKFLEILTARWPDILAEENAMDRAEHRNALLLALTRHWQESPPEGPVIAAGTTGSIPATAALLKVIAGLPQGEVILPGLDRDIDPESWNALEETHPQYGLKQLLAQFEMLPQDVPIFAEDDTGHARGRRTLAREIMRPAATSGAWATLPRHAETCAAIKDALDGVSLIGCDTESEEAGVISLLLREALEDENAKAVLITPDRTLAQRVSAQCERWGITLDDSSGRPLARTPVGRFFLLTLRAMADQCAPVSLLAALKSPLCRAGLDNKTYTSGLHALEICALRGAKPRAGLAGLRQRLHHNAALERPPTGSSPQAFTEAEKFLEHLEPILSAFCDTFNGDTPFATALQSHIKLCENLSDERLWQGEDSHALARFLSDLNLQADVWGIVTLGDYADMMESLMTGVTVRPAYGTHPRLQILGQIEARLIDADLVIMGGLNEGTWPPDPGHDPWMSRPMRRDFGLPGPERSIGLSAHDFVQSLGATRVVMTRSLRKDNAPTRPARWLTRLDTVMEAAGLDKAMLARPEITDWLAAMSHAEAPRACEQPAPKPPIEARPTALSVTQIETWLRDPYSIYARHVLRLHPIEPLEKTADAALRGSVLHDTLDRFTKEHPDALPDDSETRLLTLAKETLEAYGETPEDWHFWWPRVMKLSRWFIAQERTHRQKARMLATEIKGRMTTTNGFTLKARADRIDLNTEDGTAIIIDYKSGGSYSQKAMQDGRLPQLPLQALILQSGGFEGLQAREVSSLAYWLINGSGTGGDITLLDNDLSATLQNTQEGLERLITAYRDPNTAYHALPDPANAPRFNDYEHLERLREWGVTADQDGYNADTEAA